MSVTQYRHDIFRAIADPTRRGILKLLADREMSIASIKDCFPLSRTAVNKHLRILEDATAIVRKKVGRETRYTLNPEPFRDVKEWVAYFDQYWDENLNRLRKAVEDE